jgi:glycosyltransferase involved in cell wall biosynthesis
VPTKVLFVISGLRFGGAERMFTNIIASGRLEASLLLFSPERDLDVGCKVYLGSGRNVAQMAASIRKTIDFVKPDVVMATQSIVNLSLLIALVLHPRMARHSIMRMAYEPIESLGHWENPLYNFLAVAELLVCTVFGRIGQVVRPWEDIGNFTDAEGIRQQAEEPVEDWPSVPVVMTVGGMDRQKNQALLLRAFAEVRKEKDCRLVLIGSGVLEPRLRTMAGEGVIFLGRQANPFKYMARSSVFVLTSEFEGMSNVLLEAVALGVPCVATDTAGSRAVLDGNGKIVPRGDAKALKQAIISTMDEGRSPPRTQKDGLEDYLALFRRAAR